MWAKSQRDRWLARSGLTRAPASWIIGAMSAIRDQHSGRIFPVASGALFVLTEVCSQKLKRSALGLMFQAARCAF